jgi:cytochrome c oxidase subunit II
MTVRPVVIAAIAMTCTACGGNQSMFNPQGPAARGIASLGWFMLSVCAVVYVAVLLATAWALTRTRHVADDLPPATQSITRAVALATILTAIVLAVFTVSSVVAGRGLTSPTGPGAITVDVVGHQWWWEFTYHDITPSDVVTSPNELHIPVGVPVHIKAISRDVIHSFWVPNLHGKRDLIPGQVTNTWIQADQPGVYRGQCAEFCGHQHAHMAFVVVAEPMEKFLAWIGHQRQPAMEPASDEAQRGHDVFMQTTCVMCHTIRGTDAGARLGPELTHVGSRMTVGAGTLPNTRGHLAGWIADAPSIKPGVRMPRNALQPEELQAVLTYLRSLR